MEVKIMGNETTITNSPTTKPHYLSKTLWLNAIMGVCAAMTAVIPALAGVNTFLQANMATITIAWSVLNVILRLVTKDKLSLEE